MNDIQTKVDLETKNTHYVVVDFDEAEESDNGIQNPGTIIQFSGNGIPMKYKSSTNKQFLNNIIKLERKILDESKRVDPLALLNESIQTECAKGNVVKLQKREDISFAFECYEYTGNYVKGNSFIKMLLNVDFTPIYYQYYLTDTTNEIESYPVYVQSVLNRMKLVRVPKIENEIMNGVMPTEIAISTCGIVNVRFNGWVFTNLAPRSKFRLYGTEKIKHFIMNYVSSFSEYQMVPYFESGAEYTMRIGRPIATSFSTFSRERMAENFKDAVRERMPIWVVANKGSGKTVLRKELEEIGFNVIDSDAYGWFVSKVAYIHKEVNQNTLSTIELSQDHINRLVSEVLEEDRGISYFNVIMYSLTKQKRDINKVLTFPYVTHRWNDTLTTFGKVFTEIADSPAIGYPRFIEGCMEYFRVRETLHKPIIFFAHTESELSRISIRHFSCVIYNSIDSRSILSKRADPVVELMLHAYYYMNQVAIDKIPFSLFRQWLGMSNKVVDESVVAQLIVRE
nr:MAG: 59.1KD protein [Nilaparvata lugens reovirus]